MIEHPVITQTERTGYPHPVKEHKTICERCGTELRSRDLVFTFDGQEMCEDCVKQCIENTYSLTEIAMALKIPGRYAWALED